MGQECHKLLNKPIECHQLTDRKRNLQQKADQITNLQKTDYYKQELNGKEMVIFTSYLSSLFKIHSNFGRVYGVQYVHADSWDSDIKGDHIVLHNNAQCVCE